MIIATRTGTATTEMRQPPLSGIKTASIGLVSSERHARTHATDSRGSGRQQLNQETTAGVRCSGGGGEPARREQRFRAGSSGVWWRRREASCASAACGRNLTACGLVPCGHARLTARLQRPLCSPWRHWITRKLVNNPPKYHKFSRSRAHNHARRNVRRIAPVSVDRPCRPDGALRSDQLSASCTQ